MRTLSALRSFAAMGAVLASSAPGSAQTNPQIADFLTTIGGSNSKRTINSPLVTGFRMRPRLWDENEVIGARYFSEKIVRDADATAKRARAAFGEECRAKGGHVESENSEIDREFRGRVLAYAEGGDPERQFFWSGLSAVCSRDAATVLGGFVATIFDTTKTLPGILFGKPATKTAIFAFSPSHIVSGATLARRKANEHAQLADYVATEERREAELERFREAIQLGTYTNCGTVIELRGPLVEVALPPTQTAPNGQATFWSRREALFPPGTVICTYGL